MSAKRRRPGLIVVWVLFGLLAGGIVLLEGLDLMAPPNEPVVDARLFQFTEADLGGIQVVYDRQIASLMRGPDGLWYQHDDSHTHTGGAAAPAASGTDPEHVPDPAQSATIAQELARAAAIVVDRQGLDESDLDAYGLTRSETMVAFYGRGTDGADNSEPMDVLRIGNFEPNASVYYARLDGDRDIVLIHRDEFDALLDVVFGPGKVPTPGTD